MLPVDASTRIGRSDDRVPDPRSRRPGAVHRDHRGWSEPSRHDQWYAAPSRKALVGTITATIHAGRRARSPRVPSEAAPRGDPAWTTPGDCGGALHRCIAGRGRAAPWGGGTAVPLEAASGVYAAPAVGRRRGSSAARRATRSVAHSSRHMCASMSWARCGNCDQAVACEQWSAGVARPPRNGFGAAPAKMELERRLGGESGGIG